MNIPRGRIDLHSHLLPGIDDGCVDVAESAACVEQLIGRGFVGSVCTPHMWPTQFPDITPANVARWVDGLREELRRRSLDYTLWTGGELRIDPMIIDWMQTHGVPTLGDSRYVLVDHWGPLWPLQADELFDYLAAEGYRPILAHPERLGYDEQGMGEVLEDMAGRDVLLQGNFASLSGGEGPDAATWGRRLLREGAYDLLAMDMHRYDMLPPRFEGLAVAAMDLGDQVLDEWLIDRTAALLRDEPVGRLAPATR